MSWEELDDVLLPEEDDDDNDDDDDDDTNSWTKAEVYMQQIIKESGYFELQIYSTLSVFSPSSRETLYLVLYFPRNVSSKPCA